MPALKRSAGLIAPLLALTLVPGLPGCKSSAPAVSDSTLTEAIQGVLGADNAVAGQPVQVAVQAGVATLSGSVSNDAQRTLAARDAAGVAGVVKVVNDLGVNTPPPATASVVAPLPPAPAPTPVEKTKALVKQPAPPPMPRHQPAPIERSQPARSQPARSQPASSQPAYVEGPPPPALEAMAPPAPPPPAFKSVTIAAGDSIPVRVTQTLDSGTTQPDTAFSGVVASDIIVNGLVAIPAGTNVSGHVDAVQDAGHFKGSSLLTVSLTGINRRGDHLAVSTDPYTVQGKGRGANTAEKTGGGAAVGAILGGIFGGGKGAAIGAAAGAGAGAGSNAITRGQQVQIASESVVRFHLSAPITLKVRTDNGDRRPEDSGLQPR